MSFATANRTALYYVAESTLGTTPSNPALKTVRYTGESLNYQIKNTKSNEIRSDRATANLIQVEANSAGDINFELMSDEFDDWLEAALCGTWSGSPLGIVKNGTTLRGFTIQKYFQDPTTPFYMTYTGQVVNTLELSFQTGQILTGKFGFTGMSAATATSQISGATFPTANTKTPMNCVSNVTSILEDGITSTSYFNKLTMSLNNNVRYQRAIANLGPVGMALGTLDITGSLDLYLQNKTLVDKYIAGTTFALAVEVTDDASNTYTFKLPKIKFETATVVAGGLDQDVMLSGTVRAIYDSSTSCMIEIDRTP